MLLDCFASLAMTGFGFDTWAKGFPGFDTVDKSAINRTARGRPFHVANVTKPPLVRLFNYRS